MISAQRGVDLSTLRPTTGSRQQRTGVLAILSSMLLMAFARTAIAAEDSCSELLKFKGSIETRVDSAELILADIAKPWFTPKSLLADPLPVRKTLCRVVGTISPVPTSSIGFELWLPPPSAWNRKLHGTAAGGSTGAISYGGMTDAFERGYAVMGHDNGHKSKNVFEQSWSFDYKAGKLNDVRMEDFAHRAQHVATVISREIIKAHYLEAPKYAYYNGCSQGGHHGLMEANRYPEDYDGIITGAHGGDSTSLMASEAWAAVAALRDGGQGALPVGRSATGALTAGPQFEALAAAAMKSCDALDGLVDGQIDDPRACRFDPAVAQCGQPGTSPNSCLSAKQVAMVKDTYSGPRRSSGAQIAPGYPVGSEGGWFPYWSAATNVNSASWGDFFRLGVKGDPQFNVATIDWDKDIDDAFAKFSATKDVVNPDLTPFANRGGKLIAYHGWADPLISPYLSIRFWDQLQRRMGDAAPKFARLFMVPGMGHCRGGPISKFDALGALEKWVEEGTAPDGNNPSNTLIGSGLINGKPRSRPLCPYPKVARIKAPDLDPDVAANFACVAPSP